MFKLIRRIFTSVPEATFTEGSEYAFLVLTKGHHTPASLRAQVADQTSEFAKGIRYGIQYCLCHNYVQETPA